MLARFILGLKLAARSISFRSRPPRLAGGLATLPTVGRQCLILPHGKRGDETSRFVPGSGPAFCRRDTTFAENTGSFQLSMSPEISDLLKRALSLAVDERAALANTLLDSLDGANESISVHEAWDEEVARRIEDLKAGKAVTLPWEELHRELLAMVNER